MKIYQLLAVFMFPFLGLMNPVAAAEVVPGTSITLEPPIGFSLSKQFTGFVNEQSGATIMINEMPAPLSEIQHTFIPDLLKTKGVILQATEQATSHERKVWLYKIAQNANGVDFSKWILLQGDSKRSVMIVGTYLTSSEKEFGDVIKKSLMSIDVDEEKLNALNLDGLGYSIQESENLKIAKRINNMLALTRPGDPFPASGAEPLMVIAPSYSKTSIGDLVSFSEKHLLGTSSLIEIAVQKDSIKKLDINGNPAVELLADAENQNNHAPVKVYQLIVESNDTYYVIKGIVKVDLSEQYLAEFRKVALSLKIDSK